MPKRFTCNNTLGWDGPREEGWDRQPALENMSVKRNFYFYLWKSDDLPARAVPYNKMTAKNMGFEVRHSYDFSVITYWEVVIFSKWPSMPLLLQQQNKNTDFSFLSLTPYQIQGSFHYWTLALLLLNFQLLITSFRCWDILVFFFSLSFFQDNRYLRAKTQSTCPCISCSP